MDGLAPIVLFTYNRPWHTQQTIEALKKNKLASQSDLIVFSDGAKNTATNEAVTQVRDYLKTINGFKQIRIIEREKNWGLANSVIDGVTTIINEYGSIIVLEDDMITAENFLVFMNESLKKYESYSNVFSITGYSFLEDIDNLESTYFLSIASSRSWATWADKWKYFKRDTAELKKIVDNQSRHDVFNINGSYDYIAMARMQLAGKIDSWAIFWYMSVLEYNGLTLFPAKRLIQNIGYDGSGTHCGDAEQEKKLEIFNYVLTDEIFEKKSIRVLLEQHLKRQKNGSLLQRIVNKLKRILIKI